MRIRITKAKARSPREVDLDLKSPKGRVLPF